MQQREHAFGPCSLERVVRILPFTLDERQRVPGTYITFVWLGRGILSKPFPLARDQNLAGLPTNQSKPNNVAERNDTKHACRRACIAHIAHINEYST